MRVLITICARAGSKGLVNKNIKLLNGKPLFMYSFELAKALTEILNCEIAISSDSDKVKEILIENKFYEKYFRPNIISQDSTGKIETIKDLLFSKEKNIGSKYDYVLDLDVTSPLRNIEDILISFDFLKKNKKALNLFSVSKASKNPYFNMVEFRKETEFVKKVKNIGNKNYLTRQNSPQVFELNASFYWYRRSFFNLKSPSVINNKSIIYEVDHICFDIDNENDFKYMEYLFQKNLLDFKL